MAIKKDIDDMLNNPKNSSKQPVNKTTAPKKLAPLPQKKAVSERKPASTENKPKKRIVISNELPDYDALRAKELEKDKLKKAQEEAERKAREEAERKAREEAERKAREEAERKAREEAERKEREEAERKEREEAERKAREEAERKAREEAERKEREEAERKAREEEKKRIKAEKKAKEEEAKKRRKEERRKKRLEAEKKAEEEKKRLENERKAEEEEKKRLEAEKAVQEDEENFSIEEVTEDDIFDESESDPVGSLIDNIREDAEKAVADIENGDSYTDDNDETEDTDDEKDVEDTSFGISPVLEKILDEDPDEIINERSEKTEADDESESGSKFKKNFYAVFGVIFAVFACVGFITVVSKGISMIGGYTSGDNKKSGFESIVYPVVIMDIDSFDNPTELPSDQIITASIWSMIMSEDAISNYEMTFDVVKIPAVDVESYAVKLFGENLPALNHTTVGPAESRFYYNEETKSYNVPIAPVTYTYSPEIKGATKNGDTYTIVVNYIDELPEWLPKVSSKSVEFKLTETNEGYTIDSMKVLSTTNNSL